MDARPRALIVYQTSTGDEPFSRWFFSLRDHEAVARIARRLDRLERGNPGDCRSVGHGLMELRVNYGPGYRVYFGQDGPTRVLLLAGGSKLTQSQDIKVAAIYWRDYKERKR